MIKLAAALWISVTGPNNQPIELNVDTIVSIRPPRGSDHFGPDIRCLIHTIDGRFIAVIESCDIVHTLLLNPD